MSSATCSPSPSGLDVDDVVMESPRTKLKRELAALDSSSDEDSPSPKKQKPSSKLTLRAMPSSGEQDDSEYQDDITSRPRGRLASRMKAGNPEPELEDPPIVSPEQENLGSANIQAEAQDKDDDIVAAGRLKRDVGRQAKTPEASRKHTPQPNSPGLFVTPSHRDSPARSTLDYHDDELPPIKNHKLEALLAKKRKEREARETEEAKRVAAREKRLMAQIELDETSDNTTDITDDEGGRRLTEKSLRPTRKASKRAMEEMNRETQRIDRNRQLAHKCQNKKKVSKSALFDRFNFFTGPPVPEERPASPKRVLARSSTASSPASHNRSDADVKDSVTPPTSPPIWQRKGEKSPAAAQPAVAETQQSLIIPDIHDELPTFEEFMSAKHRADKGKGKAPHVELVPPGDKPKEPKSKEVKPGRKRVRVKFPHMYRNIVELDDDDDTQLNITKPFQVTKFDEAVARLPKKQEGSTDKILDMLIQAVSPGKERGRRHRVRNTVTARELRVDLIQRAREQARVERERRTEMLKAKGVIIETEEERLKLEEEVDDIVSRARKEAKEVAERERAAASKEGKDRTDPVALGDSDDESYEASTQEQEDEDIELSGSEEEEGDEDDEEGEASGEEVPTNPMVDDVAGDDDELAYEAEVEAEQGKDEGDDQDAAPAANGRRRRKHVNVILDDEDGSEGEAVVKATPKPPKSTPFKVAKTGVSSNNKTPTSVLRSATKPFIPGLAVPVAAPAGLGLTQMFQGTMDDSQSQPFADAVASIAPMPSIADFPFASQSQSQGGRIVDSQVSVITTQKEDDESSQPVQFNLAQTQTPDFDSILEGQTIQVGGLDTDMVLTPTQDDGFIKFTPLKNRFVDDAPANSIAASGRVEYIHGSSPPRHKGKLRLKSDAKACPPVDEDDDGEAITDTGPISEEEHEFAMPRKPASTSKNAFSEMSKGAKKAKKVAAFNKDNSKARGMIEEQAEESDDEYAGLGGADGEDSDDELDDEVQEIIDDKAGSLNERDERKLAAFHADRERADDERNVDRLFKDITTGMLRKRRAEGGDYDLSDSDDGGEARRRAKRRQFHKMQRELFKDERVSKVAENPRNRAFLRTLEDLGSDDDVDFLTVVDQGAEICQEAAVVPDSQPNSTATERPTLDEADNAGRRKEKNPRRDGQRGDRATDLDSVRELLSGLLDDAHAVIPGSVEDGGAPCDNEGDELEIQPAAGKGISSVPLSSSSDKENNPRRRRNGVVDRITLSRQSSMSSGSSSSGAGRLAFTAAFSSAGTGGVPMLLRRATTNNSLLHASSGSVNASSASDRESVGSGSKDSGATTINTPSATSGGFGDGALIKRNAGKKSGINYFARENERRAALRERESRRKARKMRGVMDRSRVVSGLFGGGEFE